MELKTMGALSLELRALPHAVFLHRAADRGGVSPDRAQAHLAQGAFLVLRLIDLLAEQRPLDPEVFKYQWAATERFCRDFPAGSTEGAHIHGLAKSAKDAARRRAAGLLTPGLFAYAHFLEDILRLEEALDVLGTLTKLTTENGVATDRVALMLRTGRVNRKLNRFDEAENAYAAAREVAVAAGDRHGELLSRIGAASTLRFRGNLPEAERRLIDVLVEAKAAGVRDAEARAEHDLAVVKQHRGSPDSALIHAWRAFELYEDERFRMRALNDVGIMLLTLGDAVGAERALTEVLRRATARELTMDATIELMYCASFKRDRMGFERQRNRCEELKGAMPPNILADYWLKAGIGEARFGNFRRAAASLEQAWKVANDAGLHAFVFKIERIKNGLSECERIVGDEAREPGADLAFESDDVRNVSASVADLVGAST
jgi:tetratricopeptide (TPR) repeat protein